MAGGEDGGEEGARVGDDVEEADDGGRELGSNSRSAMGGDSSGRRVIFKMRRRRIALKKRSSDGAREVKVYQAHLTSSRSTTPLHLVLGEVRLRRPISTNSCVN